MFNVFAIRHAYPEKDLYINRKRGLKLYTFLHFNDSVDIKVGEKAITTDPHSVIIIPPKIPHFYSCKGMLVHDWFHFLCSEDDLLLDDINLNEIYYPTIFTQITKITAEIEREYFSKPLHYETLIDSKVKELFIKLNRDLNNNSSNFVNENYKIKFRNLRGEILSNLSAPWSVKEMANSLNMSQSHFHSIYKKFFGISPTQDLINARIGAAQNILQFQSLPINKISQLLGYQNHTHFIRQFRKETGYSPLQYRKVAQTKISPQIRSNIE